MFKAPVIKLLTEFSARVEMLYSCRRATRTCAVRRSVGLVVLVGLMSADDAGGRGTEALGKAGAPGEGAGWPTAGDGSS